MESLQQLVQHTQSKDTHLHEKPRFHFTHAGKKVPGLTSWLREKCPATRHAKHSCPRCRVRGSTRRVRSACGASQPCKISKKAKKQWLPAHGSVPQSVVLSLACQGRGDRQHGCIVDDQLTNVLHAIPTPAYDPCTLSLLSYFNNKNLTIIDTQVCIYSHTLQHATAIDVLCVDTQTRSKLSLFEVKSYKRANSFLIPTCYEFAPRALASGLPLSFYNVHQLQLFCMYYTLVHEMNIQLDSVAVLRTSPTGVDEYPLRIDWKRDPNTVIHSYLQIT